MNRSSKYVLGSWAKYGYRIIRHSPGSFTVEYKASGIDGLETTTLLGSYSDELGARYGPEWLKAQGITR